LSIEKLNIEPIKLDSYSCSTPTNPLLTDPYGSFKSQIWKFLFIPV